MCSEIFTLLVTAERILHVLGGVLARFSSTVIDVLNNNYHGRWIGRGGSTSWPPRSLDLNPLDS
jgi:hypothetical protein